MTLTGYGREDELLSNHPQKTKEVRILIQRLPPHVRVIGNEIADGLTSRGRRQPQSRKTSTLECGIWSAVQLSNDDGYHKFNEASKGNHYLQGLHRSDAMQIFRARARHKFFLLDRAQHGWSTVCRLCGEREETVSRVLSKCRELANVRLSGSAAMSPNDVFWREDRLP
ncbi:hypothetical protein PoB_006874600 [Plakobranchus ocellatus]|uniref:RNase H type-1 domain-containing protein n=1 Tax=Plakobranchus ocellatus TaxID=259542 RepID=A0AAV4DEG8_9GAST|nr:hypothetical protein PoB_006874600 [Plakobranchus ocellatus]